MVGWVPVPKAMPGSRMISAIPSGVAAGIQLGRTKARPIDMGASPCFQVSLQSCSGSSSSSPARGAAAASASARSAK